MADLMIRILYTKLENIQLTESPRKLSQSLNLHDKSNNLCVIKTGKMKTVVSIRLQPEGERLYPK